jgi:hypothetical protein
MGCTRVMVLSEMCAFSEDGRLKNYCVIAVGIARILQLSSSCHARAGGTAFQGSHRYRPALLTA